MANLKVHWQQDTFVDFAALQDVSDASQDRAILVLMQLQQRIISSGPIENLTPPPLNPAKAISRAVSTSHSPYQVSGRPTDSFISSTDASDGIFVAPCLSMSTPKRSLITPGTQIFRTYFPERESRRGSIERARAEGRDLYKPMATTVTTAGIFGIGKRTKVEPVVSPPENPLVDEYLANAMDDVSNGLSRANSMSTRRSPVYEADSQKFNPWEDYQTPSPTFSQIQTGPSRQSFVLTRRVPTPNLEALTSARPSSSMLNPRDLPSETNKYAGFCKGAWRQQTGDRKKAMEEQIRPGGIFNATKYWQCKKCKFEGRLVPVDKKRSGYDMRVFRLVEGIQFRWEFMFKSHVQIKVVSSDPTKATFGCVFCCAEGQGTPTFSGIQAFMNHLVAHRDHLPTGAVLYRMNCLVGRQAATDEDFDINIIRIEGSMS